MAVLVDFEWAGPGVLDGISKAMQRSDAGIAAPREHQLGCASHADHLVKEEIRRETDEDEIRQALSDDFVTGRKRNQMGEPLHGDAVTVMDERLDGLGKCQNLCHRPPLCVIRTIDLIPNKFRQTAHGCQSRCRTFLPAVLTEVTTARRIVR